MHPCRDESSVRAVQHVYCLASFPSSITESAADIGHPFEYKRQFASLLYAHLMPCKLTLGLQARGNATFSGPATGCRKSRIPAAIQVQPTAGAHAIHSHYSMGSFYLVHYTAAWSTSRILYMTCQRQFCVQQAVGAFPYAGLPASQAGVAMSHPLAMYTQMAGRSSQS